MIAVMLGTTRTGDVVSVIMTTVEVAVIMIVIGITTGIRTMIETGRHRSNCDCGHYDDRGQRY